MINVLKLLLVVKIDTEVLFNEVLKLEIVGSFVIFIVLVYEINELFEFIVDLSVRSMILLV